MNFMTKICIVLYALTCMSTEIHSYTKAQRDCIRHVCDSVERIRDDLSMEAIESSDTMCTDVWSVITSVFPRGSCTEKPYINVSEFEQVIYEALIKILDEQKMYAGTDLPQSFHDFKLGVVAETKAALLLEVQKLAYMCDNEDEN